MLSYHEENRENAQIKIKKYEQEKAKERQSKQTVESMVEEPPKKETNAKVDLSKISDQGKLEPFARITEVKIDSPAHKGGLLLGDLMLKYGKASILNHNELKYVIEITKENIGKKINILVNRKGIEKELSITPNKWVGPGVLGCRFDVIA